MAETCSRYRCIESGNRSSVPLTPIKSVRGINIMLTFLLNKMESGEIKGFIILGIRLRKTMSIKRLVLNFIMGSSSKMLQITSLEFSQLSQNSQKKELK